MSPMEKTVYFIIIIGMVVTVATSPFYYAKAIKIISRRYERRSYKRMARNRNLKRNKNRYIKGIINGKSQEFYRRYQEAQKNSDGAPVKVEDLPEFKKREKTINSYLEKAGSENDYILEDGGIDSRFDVYEAELFLQDERDEEDDKDLTTMEMIDRLLHRKNELNEMVSDSYSKDYGFDDGSGPERDESKADRVTSNGAVITSGKKGEKKSKLNFPKV